LGPLESRRDSKGRSELSQRAIDIFLPQKIPLKGEKGKMNEIRERNKERWRRDHEAGVVRVPCQVGLGGGGLKGKIYHFPGKLRRGEGENTRDQGKVEKSM